MERIIEELKTSLKKAIKNKESDEVCLEYAYAIKLLKIKNIYDKKE